MKESDMSEYLIGATYSNHTRWAMWIVGGAAGIGVACLALSEGEHPVIAVIAALFVMVGVRFG
jgi:uncharacterized membrane protein